MQAALINVISYPQNCLAVESAQKLVLSDYASNLRRLAEQLVPVGVVEVIGDHHHGWGIGTHRKPTGGAQKGGDNHQPVAPGGEKLGARIHAN